MLKVHSINVLKQKIQ